MGSVLVHIDLDGDRPCAASMSALAAGRAVASSWGATLYAVIVVHDGSERRSADSTGHLVTSGKVPGTEAAQQAIARGGADKIVVAVSDAPVAPLWSSVGIALQSVLDHLRPRLVLFGADAPSAAELAPRTGARLGARLLMRARAVGGDEVELRDRDGGYARASDGGAAVALIAGTHAAPRGDDDVDLVVLAVPGTADPRVELAGTSTAEAAQTTGALVVLGDDVANDAVIARDTMRLAAAIGAQVVAGGSGARAAFAPELCVVVGSAPVDVSGSTSLVRIGGTGGGKGVDGALAGDVAPQLAALLRALEAT